MTGQRPYAALLAKGADTRQRILAVAQRLLVRQGWRTTTLGQIAREAGVSTAGLLHHFDSKDNLLHAVLEARDAYDEENLDPTGARDIFEQVEGAARRFREVPHLVGMFVVLLIENLDANAPLHDRLGGRYQAALAEVAAGIRRGQLAGRYRTDLDPALKAVEIVAFLYGMETSWLLDPSIPLTEVFKEYTRSLSRQLTGPAAGRSSGG
ncbi:TetR/AcrR family transcriptional regulator [Amycolatopsis acidicola]|uniref:TetR/AcrR family transcriptional regulator n=1 Tax=Amycolatopsis acidicola TaxID=2596893 RepID=A0A5N0UKB6_9PSEU|nr:TetR/AcrR family transcriptional regulator [Amycolatopsis acidicola]KAA9149879.1 TetR/AcrR family transcriptional regulator [Amycolatopsis acidicola]